MTKALQLHIIEVQSNERAIMKGYIQSKLKAYQAERRRQRWLNAKLEQFADPHFLLVATFVDKFERQTGAYVTRQAIERLRQRLEAAA